MNARVDVVIPSWNTRELLSQCLDSLCCDPTCIAEIIVVDNASSDRTREMLAERFPAVKVIRNEENLGFATAANRGVREARTPYVMVLNSDARLEPGALGALCRVLDERPQVGVVGAQTLDPDGSFQASHASFPSLLGEFLILSGIGRLLYGKWYPSYRPTSDEKALPADYVSGACLLIRRTAIDAVGGFDESYFLYAEEVDLCRRLRDSGWEVWHAPAARVRHVGGASSRGRQREAALYRGRALYFRKHARPAATTVLKAMILASVVVKRLVHGAIRFVSGGRLGRQVVEVRTVRAALRHI